MANIFNLTLHTELHQLLQENFDDKERSVAATVINYLIASSLKRTKMDTNYTSFSFNLFQARFSGRRHYIFMKLKALGIINAKPSETSKESYIAKGLLDKITGRSNEAGISKQYRVNPKFSTFKAPESEVFPETSTIAYGFYKKRISKKAKESTLEHYNAFVETVAQLDIDYPKLYQITEEEVAAVDASGFILDNDIKAETIKVTNVKTGKTYVSSRDKAQKHAFLDFRNLIQDGKNYYHATVEEYINYKKNNIRFSYHDSINKLRNGDYYASRNETNNRLDTNFTNMSGRLFKSIIDDNDLVSIDLANSQFAILAHSMKKSLKSGILPKDYYLFADEAYKGTLYDSATSLLGYEKRSQTKIAFFETLFSKSTKESEHKKSLTKVYPTVMGYVDQVKNAGNYKDLSIGLQKYEASIFIDKILPRLQEQIEFVLTKHDSVIVKRDQLELAQDIIQEYFNEISFEGTMKVED